MAVVTLYFVATATFILMHSVPGNPLQQEKAMSDVIRQNLEEKYGLNKPVLQQYTTYMTNMFFKFDFGISFKQVNLLPQQILFSWRELLSRLGYNLLRCHMLHGSRVATLVVIDARNVV